MEPFKPFTGLVGPLDRLNIDTDQIIPKQFLKLVQRTGFGQYLFYDWRFDPSGKLRSEFILNNPDFQGATILLARANFGCGSSREHAAWSLQDYGFRAIIAPSFADIFYNNCFKNGILPIALGEENVDYLFRRASSVKRYTLKVDLVAQALSEPDGRTFSFEIDSFRKKCLLEGLDDIGLTLKLRDKIVAYEAKMGAVYVRPE